MSLSIYIGKNSTGDNIFIKADDIPLLIISYCREEQLTRIFKQFRNLQQVERNYMITNSRRFNEWGFRKENFITFLRDLPSFDINSRAKLLKQILNEINNRKRSIKNLTEYHLLQNRDLINLKNNLNERYLIIDDIWDIITSIPKTNALNLLLIMLYGPEVGIRTIFASIISYINLLQQLVHLHPQLKIELKKKYSIPEPKLISDVGHELIFSIDDFVYYRSGQNLERYFK